jgi:hypothetical protein
VDVPDALLAQLGRIVRYEEGLERYLKDCKAATLLAEMELRAVRLRRKSMTDQILHRGAFATRVPVVVTT